jgi:hypothetical protein
MSFNSDENWFLVIIDDPALLPGKSIFDVINHIRHCIEFKFVILNDIEGAGQNWLIPILHEKENMVLEIDQFLEIVCKVEQFDWGDFFLFKNYPTNWDSPKGKSYPYLIAQTDTTLRAVDDQYIYVYTKNQKIVDVLKKEYKIESVKTGSLGHLEYPY